jgi:hypothetical protein
VRTGSEVQRHDSQRDDCKILHVNGFPSFRSGLLCAQMKRVRSRVTTNFFMTETSCFDLDLRSDFDPIEQINHIEIVHAHAAATRRCAERRFGIGAVDVNVTLESVGIFGVESFEPEDASLHMVVIIILFAKASGSLAAHENLSRWRAVADLLSDAKSSGRRALRAGLGAESEA